MIGEGFEDWDHTTDGRLLARQLSFADGGVKNHVGLLRLGIRIDPKQPEPLEYLQLGISPSGVKQLHQLLGRMLDAMGLPKDGAVQ